MLANILNSNENEWARNIRFNNEEHQHRSPQTRQRTQSSSRRYHRKCKLNTVMADVASIDCALTRTINGVEMIRNANTFFTKQKQRQPLQRLQRLEHKKSSSHFLQDQQRQCFQQPSDIPHITHSFLQRNCSLIGLMFVLLLAVAQVSSTQFQIVLIFNCHVSLISTMVYFRYDVLFLHYSIT